jgi:hypothetical protein
VVTVSGSGFTGIQLGSVGAGKNAAVSVVSDTRVKVTVPAGSTSGAIGLINASHTAFSATAFTVTDGSAAPAPPAIANFSPSSGPAGTVVTVNGSGFTGATVAWVGNAKNGAVQVVSDGQVRVTIPAGATSGAIGIFNPSGVAFTATAFTVAGATAGYVQPGIMNFSPSSGPAGTVVTINGSGFTGANVAWVGNAHNAPVRVVSDSQVRVTIPAGATTGAIGIFNPAHVAFTATSFTVR